MSNLTAEEFEDLVARWAEVTWVCPYCGESNLDIPAGTATPMCVGCDRTFFWKEVKDIKEYDLLSDPGNFDDVKYRWPASGDEEPIV